MSAMYDAHFQREANADVDPGMVRQPMVNVDPKMVRQPTPNVDPGMVQQRKEVDRYATPAQTPAFVSGMKALDAERKTTPTDPKGGVPLNNASLSRIALEQKLGKFKLR
jgi:hypothetical protein